MKIRDIILTSVETLHRSDRLTVAEDIITIGRIPHLPVVGGQYRIGGLMTH